MKNSVFCLVFALMASLFLTGCSSRRHVSADPDFHIFLCFGQSNMEGNAPVEAADTLNVSDRFLVMCATDDDARGRVCGEWYRAVPPLCDAQYGLCPADGFGRTLLEALPEKARVGVINVSVGGIDIRGFIPDTLFQQVQVLVTDVLREDCAFMVQVVYDFHVERGICAPAADRSAEIDVHRFHLFFLLLL